MGERAYVVAKADRDLKRGEKHGPSTKMIALSGLSGAALAQVLAHSALGAGVNAGGKALVRTIRRKPPVRVPPKYRPMLVDMPPPPRQLVMPIARRHR